MYYILVSCLYYYILYIIASFILPLTRSLSDDPGFACPGWRSELPYYQIVPWIHIGDSSSRPFIGIFIFVSVSSFIPIFLSVMIANRFLQVFLYLLYAGTHVSIEIIYCTEA